MRLAEFGGRTAGSSLKAAKYPECLPRALNPGGTCLQSLAAFPAIPWWLEDAWSLHSHGTCSLMLCVFGSWFSKEKLFCLSVYLQTDSTKAVHPKEVNTPQVL